MQAMCRTVDQLIPFKNLILIRAHSYRAGDVSHRSARKSREETPLDVSVHKQRCAFQIKTAFSGSFPEEGGVREGKME